MTQPAEHASRGLGSHAAAARQTRVRLDASSRQVVASHTASSLKPHTDRTGRQQEHLTVPPGDWPV